MKRDGDLIIDLLTKLESLPLPPGALAILDGNTEELAVGGRTQDEIEYHLGLIKEAGFVDSPGSQPAAGGITFRGLTNAGHDFLMQQSKEGSSNHLAGPQLNVFNKIRNALHDLQRADFNTFGRFIKRLSRAVHTPELESLNKKLTDGIDVEAWLEAARREDVHGFARTEIEWPHELEKELGTCILLIDKFASNPDQAMVFSNEFYYIDDRSITKIYQNLVSQMIAPFVRDYLDHIAMQIDSYGSDPVRNQELPVSKKVFIVHGHDEGAREMVARFLEQLGLEPIILHEQPNRGRTVIEKVEAHGGVSFAVVLLTPDDEGRVRGGPTEPRARQNVLLELGYFLGRLGRENVCALKRGIVEIPSDFAGVVWEVMDASNGWKQALGRELRAAGHMIDWNTVMR